MADFAERFIITQYDAFTYSYMWEKFDLAEEGDSPIDCEYEQDCSSEELYDALELREKHYNQLKEAGVSEYICDHFFDISGCLAPMDDGNCDDPITATKLRNTVLGLIQAMEEKYGGEYLNEYVQSPPLNMNMRLYTAAEVYMGLNQLENSLCTSEEIVHHSHYEYYIELVNEINKHSLL